MNNQTSTGKYDATKIRLATTPAIGTKIDAVVINISEGLQSQFIEEAVYKTWKFFDPQQPCIRVCAEGNYEGYIVRREMNIALPTNNNIAHPKSRIGRWMKYYGSAPVIGQKIQLYSNPKGFWDIWI